MSDESNVSPVVSEYEPESSESDSSDDPSTAKKRVQVFSDAKLKRDKATRALFSDAHENLPSTSSFQIQSYDSEHNQPDTNSIGHIDSVIEDVIAQSVQYCLDSNADASTVEIIWGEVTGENLRTFKINVFLSSKNTTYVLFYS